MALQLPFTVSSSAEPYLPPRDIMPTTYTCWERGGTALLNIDDGIDVQNWFFVCDPLTGIITVEVPGVIPAVTIHTITAGAKEFTGSFDLNMRPVLAWRDASNVSFIRWYNGSTYQTDTLPARTFSLRLALDDVRRIFFNDLQTVVVLAFTRGGGLYYRTSADNYVGETHLTGGFSQLGQIGMTTGQQFQLSRPGESLVTKPDLNYKRPVNRESKVAGFDTAGDAALYDFIDSGIEGPTGFSNEVDKHVVTTNGQLIFLRGEDGVWKNTSVEVRVDFYIDDVNFRASRTFEFSIDRQGYITRVQSASDGEAVVQLVEAGVGTRTYTLTAALDMGRGVTFHIVSVQGLPTTGDFLPQYNSAGDFYGGGLVPTGRVHYADYGTFVTLNLSGDGSYTSRSASTRMRWGSGSLPVSLRPVSARSAVCRVDNNGETVEGVVTLNTDGSAEFYPLAVASTRLVRGDFAVTSDQIRTKGLPSDWQLTYTQAGASDFSGVPVLTDIDPDDVVRFTSSIDLTVTGLGFKPTSVVRVDGTPVSTAYNNSTELIATLPDLDATGTFDISVFTPTPGGGTSSTLPFDIYNPAPVITSLSPDDIDEDEPTFTLTVNGTGFIPESVVYFDGVSRTTTFVNSTQVTASIPGTAIVNAGDYDVFVRNITPGGGDSADETFTVIGLNPAPTLTSITPSTQAEDLGATNLALVGTGFIPTSVARWDGSDRTTTYNSSTSLTMALGSGDVDDAGTFAVTVFNPTPGGGTSGSKTFTVTVALPDTPTILDVTATSAASFTTSHSLNMPGTIVAGDLLIALVSVSNDTISTFTGWTQLVNATSFSLHNYVYYKVAAGSDTATVVLAGSEQVAAEVVRVQKSTYAASSYIEAASATFSIDPPSLTPSWGSAKNLWIAFVVASGGSPFGVSSYPLASNNRLISVPNTGGGVVTDTAMCSENSTNSVKNPGAYTFSGSPSSFGPVCTIAVKPA